MREQNSNGAEAGLKLSWYPVINNDFREAEVIKTILQTHHSRARKKTFPFGSDFNSHLGESANFNENVRRGCLSVLLSLLWLIYIPVAR